MIEHSNEYISKTSYINLQELEVIKTNVHLYYFAEGLVKLLPLHNLYHLPVVVNIYKADRLLEANYILYEFKEWILKSYKACGELTIDIGELKYSEAIKEVRYLGKLILEEINSSNFEDIEQKGYTEL